MTSNKTLPTQWQNTAFICVYITYEWPHRFCGAQGQLSVAPLYLRSGLLHHHAAVYGSPLSEAGVQRRREGWSPSRHVSCHGVSLLQKRLTSWNIDSSNSIIWNWLKMVPPSFSFHPVKYSCIPQSLVWMLQAQWCFELMLILTLL